MTRISLLCAAWSLLAACQPPSPADNSASPATETADAYPYPYPVETLTLEIEDQTVSMAYMDVTPAEPNGRAVILFHGKNFAGHYWGEVAAFLAEAGFRVIIPDQVGWGRSDAPHLHYSFHMLAHNNKALLDTLGIGQVSVIGHSMGGMLAARFALMYGDHVEKLILENPIGLEDYKTFVPYRPLDAVYQGELAATYESYLAYQKTYYPEWKPEYEALVEAQAAALGRADFPDVAWANALTYQMIYEQPVMYEFPNLRVPTLLVIGQEDRTVVGKGLLSEADKARYGQYPQLGRQTRDRIPGSTLLEMEGVGHIPHIQTLDRFREAVLAFL